MSPKNSNGTAAERRRQWLIRNGRKLAQGALAGYQQVRRGAIVVYEGEYDRSQDRTPAQYLDERGIRASGLVWSDNKTIEWIHTYDPNSEFIVVLVDERGVGSSYRFQFGRAGGNPTMSA